VALRPEFERGKKRSEGGTDGQRWGLPRGAQSGDGGGKRRPRRSGVVRLLFGRGRVRQGAVGSENQTDAWRKQSMSKGGGPCRPVGGARPAAARGQRVRVTCTVRALPAEQRGMGEADGWAPATVPGGGVADERGPSGSGRGREEPGADRRDRPVSGPGRRRGHGLRGAHVGARGPAREGEGVASLDE
jgi:hypothetical protein